MKIKNLKEKKKARKEIKKLIKQYKNRFMQHSPYYYFLNKHAGFNLHHIDTIEYLMENYLKEGTEITTACFETGYYGDPVFYLWFRHSDGSVDKFEITLDDLPQYYDEDFERFYPDEKKLRGGVHWHLVRALLDGIWIPAKTQTWHEHNPAE